MARDGHLRGDEGPDDGHTERLADLPGRRGDARSDPGLGPRHARHGSVGDGCVHETEADAEDHIGDEEPRERGRAADEGQHGAADGEGDTRDDERDARAAHPNDAPGDRGQQHGHGRHRQRVESGAQRREATDLLEVEGVQEQEAAKCSEGGHRDERRAGEGDGPEEAQLDERFCAARLVEQDADQARPGERKGADDQP